jgi:O-acetyl-ADP-ribose deacetylase (regulator of RNase III)
MAATKSSERLTLLQGDITQQAVDAIVNAGNESLLGGGGVDGAIHRGAGPELLKECQTLHGCPTGQAKITKGYKLPARHVIHTVGPVWQGGGQRESQLLAGCYRSCFELVEKHQLNTIAFPSISTGAYGYPVGQAAKIAIAEIKKALERLPALTNVTVVCFDQRTYEAYQAAVAEAERAQ